MGKRHSRRAGSVNAASVGTTRKRKLRGGARRRLSEDRRRVRVSGALQPTGGTA
jgi:hypothetical protein